MEERPNSNEPPHKSITAGLPSIASYYADENTPPASELEFCHWFECQECEVFKPDVIGYTLPAIFLTPRLMRWDYLIKCRRCMRRHILARLWLAVLLAHVFSPFIIAWWTVVLIQTYIRKPG